MNNETPESDEAKLARVKQEASEWVVKQSYGFSPEEQDAFFDWLAGDSDHADAYASRKKTWKHLDILADWRPEHSLKPNPDLLDTTRPSASRFSNKVIRLVGAIAAVLAISLGVWQFAGNSGPDTLAKGAFAESYERHVLEDGSVVELNRGAQAMVHFTDTGRHVELLRGEAHFTISKDAERPFVVVAQGVAVQAVGTMFNVQIGSDTVDVLVTEGRVMVGPSLVDEPILDVEALGSTVQELRAGQRSVVSSSAYAVLPKVELIAEVEIEKELTWLNQLLVFNSTPIDEIVMELNRRNKRKIVIEDSFIRDIEMTVNIQPNNIDGFIGALELTKNIKSERVGDSVIVLRAKN